MNFIWREEGRETAEGRKVGERLREVERGPAVFFGLLATRNKEI